MKITDHIASNVLLPRLNQTGVLVVYDPAGRYRHICEMLRQSSPVELVDAGVGSLQAREKATEFFRSAGQPGAKSLLIYVPAARPVSEEDLMRDPFSVYVAGGSVFPQTDADSFLSLCLQANPGKSTQIRQLFQNGQEPDLVMIDALDSGTDHPILRSRLKVDSIREILMAILAPSAEQEEALKGSEDWITEARGLFRESLGLRLVTKGKTLKSIATELWTYILFSEFVFDLPEELPHSLTSVPMAPSEARALVESICDHLRQHSRTRDPYIIQAEIIERELDLANHCSAIQDLGERDTFPFEERKFLSRAVDALLRGDLDTVRLILDQRSRSVWVNRGEGRSDWDLIRASLSLVGSAHDSLRDLKDRSLDLGGLIHFYAQHLCQLDRMHREFEQTRIDLIHNPQLIQSLAGPVVKIYRKVVDLAQDQFIRLIKKEGYTAEGVIRNDRVFETYVEPPLQNKSRVAYFQIDALRYELGAELEKQFTDQGQRAIVPALANIPTATRIGMASLLPGGHDLQLKKEGGELSVYLGSEKIGTVPQRMEVIRQKYGDRFHDLTLQDLVFSTPQISKKVDLLVVRSTEIDQQMETMPDQGLSLISGTLRQIRIAVHKLQELGFQEVVIATDHGFFLDLTTQPGNICSKPHGTWVNIHNRCLLGAGNESPGNLLLPAQHLGVHGDFHQVAFPETLVAYAAGVRYFHGGISLQECVVPIMHIRLQKEIKSDARLEVRLTYRAGTQKITTRLPVLDLQMEIHSTDLFAQQKTYDLYLEARNSQDQIVGTAKRSEPVDPATGILSLTGQSQVAVTLNMTEDFEGKFKVFVKDATTQVTYSTLSLETNYLM